MDSLRHSRQSGLSAITTPAACIPALRFFGLINISPAARLSLMNPGNLVTPPTDADQQAVEALWGRCR